MDFNIEVRKKQLDSLDQLISSSRDRLYSVLKYLGWNEEQVEKEVESVVKCPSNATHNVPPKNVRAHVEKCVVKSEGYDLTEKFLSEPPENSKQTIYLDNVKKIEILSRAYTEIPNFRQAWNGRDPDPKTSDRLISTFSPHERLVIYDYSIQNTVGPTPPPEFTTIHDKKRNEDKPLTYEELLAQERDAKRRRAKYRSVHVNRKNHTEVMREVINGQMEEYKEWIMAKKPAQNEDCNSNNSKIAAVNNGKGEELDRPHSSVSRNSNHSSSSRSTSRKHRSRERYRSNDRSRYERTYRDGSRHRDRSPRRRDSRRRSAERSRERRSSQQRERSRSRRDYNSRRH